MSKQIQHRSRNWLCINCNKITVNKKCHLIEDHPGIPKQYFTIKHLKNMFVRVD